MEGSYPLPASMLGPERGCYRTSGTYTLWAFAWILNLQPAVPPRPAGREPADQSTPRMGPSLAGPRPGAQMQLLGSKYRNMVQKLEASIMLVFGPLSGPGEDLPRNSAAGDLKAQGLQVQPKRVAVAAALIPSS